MWLSSFHFCTIVTCDHIYGLPGKVILYKMSGIPKVVTVRGTYCAAALIPELCILGIPLKQMLWNKQLFPITNGEKKTTCM